MKYIFKYNNFNDSCEELTNIIWDTIEYKIKDNSNFIEYFNYYNSDFKLNNIELKFSFNKKNENSCYGLTDLTKAIIKNDQLEFTNIHFIINYNIIDDYFLYYIKSVIFHEILHVFQNYNLKINNKFRTESWSIGSILPQLRTKTRSEYVLYILDILYYSLSHELSAQLHQYYIHKIDNREYKKLNDIKNLLQNFKIKKIDPIEETELNFIKRHIINSINYYTNNNKYKKDINQSIWNMDNDKFLIELSNLLKKKIKWIDKKIKLIDKKIEIKYNETFTYYGDLEDYKYIEFLLFVENLNDCPLIDFI